MVEKLFRREGREVTSSPCDWGSLSIPSGIATIIAWVGLIAPGVGHPSAPSLGDSELSL